MPTKFGKSLFIAYDISAPALFGADFIKEKKSKLVITVKPSVAQSLAKVIGAREREAGYLEGNGYLVS